MTNDNDIIKALECCKKRNCGDCSYNAYGTSCSNIIASDTLDLINCQQAEIERLGKELIKQQLKNNMLYETAKEAKSEAIKEFAERLKEKVPYIVSHLGNISVMTVHRRIDNLVKEMTEEKQ